MTEISFGRLENPDSRDELYPVSAILQETPDIPEKYWWANGWWGNQGSTSQCVVYSWMHWLEDGPVIQDAILGRPQPMYNTTKFYKECQRRDPWPGEDYDGTSVRAGAKILKHLGIISEYRWARTINDVVNTVLTLGPMVVGTKWYSGMSRPNSKGIMTPTGKQNGGHAYLINGVDKVNRFFRVKNSWGQNWGKKGYAFISFDDFETLLKDGGEACIAFENKLFEVPDLATLPPA